MATQIIEHRFWSKVDRSGGPTACWLWTASVYPAGYGQFNLRIDGLKKAPKQAHRVAYWLTYGLWPPPGLCVCHTCDVRACVNPAHLFLGTDSDNHADMRAKNRHSNPPRLIGSRHHMARLTEADARAILIDPRSARLVARDYRVATATVSMLRCGKTWRHL